MIVEAKLSHLKGVKPHEYAVRFLFGGLCTVAAGLIASHWGAGIGGLFLAFPAIFPAGATLIEQHEIEHKSRIGADGERRGRKLAGIDALGAGLACIGMIAFAAVVWRGIDSHGPVAVIALATLAWLIVSTLLWITFKRRHLRGLHKAG